MPEADLLVVGSGPAGVAAAVAFAEAGGGRVVLATADADAPYERPPLSKEFLRGEADDGGFPLEDERLGAAGAIEVRLDSAVTALDPALRTATLADGSAIGFGACVLATGAAPLRPAVPGADLPGVLSLRSLADARALRAAAGDARSAVVVGSGFIGCEAATSLARLGLDVALVTTEAAPQETRLGPGAAERIAGWLRAEGVDLRSSSTLRGIEAVDGRLVVAAGGDPIAADLVLLATGIVPLTDVAQQAGLTLADGRIRVDAGMRTHADGVFAAGDAVLADNAAAGRPLAVEHWDDAAAMGRIAGLNAAGQADQWAGVPGFWTQIGDNWLQYAAWGDGYDESRLVEHGADSFTVWYSRAGRLVGVLTCAADEDYERGIELIASGAPAPV